MLITATLLGLLTGCGGSDPKKSDADPKEARERRDREGGSPKERKREARHDKKMEDGKLPTEPWRRLEDPCAEVTEAGAYLYPFEFEGTSYEVPLYMGPSAGKRDMVFLLHGGKGNAPSILKKSHFHTKAMAEGFVAVAPNAEDLAGTGNRWNTGKFDKELKERLPPDTKIRDDVAFLDALAERLRREVCADKVVAVGFSSGAQMTQTWACKGNQVDAVLSAAGALLVADRLCNRPTPVLGLVGRLDPLYSAGPNENDPTQPSGPESVALWAKQNGCDDTPPQEKRVDDANCFNYSGCKVPTQLCVIDDFPHGYPSPTSDDGKTCTFDATEYGWTWWREHAKK